MNRPKEFLYVGHYIDTHGHYILKVGTTNDLNRRKTEHQRKYRKAKEYTMPKNGEFVYDWAISLSKYNTFRYEDSTREAWQTAGIGKYVRNDRFNCGNSPPPYVFVTIRNTYKIDLSGT